jgi:hypothetical protein
MQQRRSTATTLAIGAWVASMALAVLGYQHLRGDHGGVQALVTLLATVALLVIASLYAGALVRGARQAARRLYLGQLALALAFVAGSVAQAGLGRSGRIAALAAVVLLAGYLAERLAPGVPTSTERKPGRAGVSIVFEVTYCVAAAITAVLGMFVGGMRCDEGARVQAPASTGPTSATPGNGRRLQRPRSSSSSPRCCLPRPWAESGARGGPSSPTRSSSARP